MRFIARLIASGLGSGFSPIAPGTAGSLLAVLLIFAAGEAWNTPVALSLTVILYFVGVAACNSAEKDWGHDNGRMVIDEVAGMCLAAAFMPARPGLLAAAFFAFRFFDIVKPFPARRAEHLPGGWGVMTDDIVAGLYALLVMTGIQRWM